MSYPSHTYGPTCHLARSSSFIGSKEEDDDIPPLKAQFFYDSPLPIDDPLTAIPTPNSSDSRSAKHIPRPFSAYDNCALEESWLGLVLEKDHRHHRRFKNSPLRSMTREQKERRLSVIKQIATKHNQKHSNEGLTGNEALCTNCMIPAQQCSCSHDNVDDHLHSLPNATRQQIPGAIKYEATEMEHDDINNRKGSPSRHSVGEFDHINKDATVQVCCTELAEDVKAEQTSRFAGITRDWESRAEKEQLMREIMEEVRRQREMSNSSRHSETIALSTRLGQFSSNRNYGAAESALPSVATHDTMEATTAEPPNPDMTTTEFPGDASLDQDSLTYGHNIRAIRNPRKQREAYEENIGSYEDPVADRIKFVAPGSLEVGTTGFPFQRVSSNTGSSRPASPLPESVLQGEVPAEHNDDNGGLTSMDTERPHEIHERHKSESIHVHRHVHRRKSRRSDHEVADIPVGISRLHLVKLPTLQMMPIYWSPVHDVAIVTRGTWFYKNTMYPVQPAVANQLEMGYRELRPWSQTWQDELNSAVEVGAAGEEKITHRLWPKEGDQTIDGIPVSEQTAMTIDPDFAKKCFPGEVAVAGTIDLTATDEKIAQRPDVLKAFPNSHVIYKDATNAFILKPSLLPSEYFGRRPLAKVRRGFTVGLHVVRGFSWKFWDRVHPSKKSSSARKAEQVAPVAGSASMGSADICTACREHEQRPKVTDLIFVIHGIGQKLSERVESFHFTHATNAFRRSVNVELGNDAVKKVLREDLGGVMVLPINWRSNLSLEDGGPMQDGTKQKDHDMPTEFGLKDITPNTIPAVRNLISDVMLDIPFYMSHHKPRMIEALIMEANRVYRLWCKNNPEFQERGRVHILAHSLGTAMALEILSKQPTLVPKTNFSRKKISKTQFEFNTTNLFFIGSPAGFFLLLDRGRLIPRRARNKPGADLGDSNSKETTDDAGVFGCLAVDNLYNVMHYNDPIAYRLNATVDPMYAKFMKSAQVPSATMGLLQSIGHAMRSIAPGASSPEDLAVGEISKPSVIQRLPSQLEMEVHDFTREEIAEKKFYLLNDNGQIDYFLSSGGGTLEIQYLNMLGAHSSYWSSADFIRMLVTEIGRKPGKSSTLPNMRVVKEGPKK